MTALHPERTPSTGTKRQILCDQHTLRNRPLPVPPPAQNRADFQDGLSKFAAPASRAEFSPSSRGGSGVPKAARRRHYPPMSGVTGGLRAGVAPIPTRLPMRGLGRAGSSGAEMRASLKSSPLVRVRVVA